MRLLKTTLPARTGQLLDRSSFDHDLAMSIVELPSPNYNHRNAPIDILLMHYTGMQSAQAALDRLCDPKAKVSAHYVVDEDGTTYQLVDEELRAWHAVRLIGPARGTSTPMRSESRSSIRAMSSAIAPSRCG